MSCDRSVQVHAYHDDALAAPARGAVEAHLAQCADCRALLADLRSLSGLLAVAPLAAVSPRTMARLNSGLRAARDRGLLRISSWLTAAAAAVLIGALWLVPERHSAGGGSPGGVVATMQTPAWETVAVMPPQETDENVPDVVVLAQWMANDLSYGERQ